MDLNRTAVPGLTPTLLSGSGEQATRELTGEPAQDSPVLVVGPSLGTSVTALWGPALPWLRKHFTVIGWDLPGHGESTPSERPFTVDQLADAVEAMIRDLLDEYGLSPDRPMFAAGVSIGGAVSLSLAVREDSPFTAYAVICSGAKLGEPRAWRERAELVEQAGTPTMVEGSAQRWFAPGFMAAQPETAGALLRSLQHTDRHSYAHTCFALSQYDLRENLSEITRPVLAIAGEQDPAAPPAQSELIAEHAPGARTEVIADVGHLAPAEAPEHTARLLKEQFLG